MVRIRGNVRGTENISSNIDNYLSQMNNRMSSATRNITNEIEKRAKRKAPVDSGELVDSITSEFSSRIGSDLFEGAVRAVAPHAPYIEFGTSLQQPQPFLKPAFNEAKENARREVQRAHNRSSNTM